MDADLSPIILSTGLEVGIHHHSICFIAVPPFFVGVTCYARHCGQFKTLKIPTCSLPLKAEINQNPLRYSISSTCTHIAPEKKVCSIHFFVYIVILVLSPAKPHIHHIHTVQPVLSKKLLVFRFLKQSVFFFFFSCPEWSWTWAAPIRFIHPQPKGGEK